MSESRARTIDGLAPETQDEFDRVWMALDALTVQVQELDQREAKSSRTRVVVRPQDTQQAPSPDYRIGSPVAQVVDAHWPEVDDTHHGVAGPVEGPCGCEESVALRSQVADKALLLERYALLKDELAAANAQIDAVRSLLPEWERQTPGVLSNGYTERCARQVREAIAWQPAAPKPTLVKCGDAGCTGHRKAT